MSCDVGSSLSSSLLQNAAVVKKAVAEEFASSSSTNYKRSWRLFMSFCEANDLLHLPAKADTVALYFGHLATCNLYSSILNACAAIRHFHVLKFPEYLPPTDFTLVKSVVGGLRRSLKPTAKPKRGFTLQNLDEFMAYLLPGGMENCSLLELRKQHFSPYFTMSLLDSVTLAA